ncbi:MAG TPA: AsnC family protein [Acetobacteraceae bacterium]|nr:AsnC family protein [Acetobacteraceae bacterium]
MPTKLIWTDAQDTQIKRLRLEGASWDTIATTLGLSRWSVIERGRRINACQPPPTAVVPPEDPRRPPLPPGHPKSWGVLTVGTVLENAPYPLPVFSS